jgi:ferric iron reductase protein FhuF
MPKIQVCPTKSHPIDKMPMGNPRPRKKRKTQTPAFEATEKRSSDESILPTCQICQKVSDIEKHFETIKWIEKRISWTNTGSYYVHIYYASLWTWKEYIESAQNCITCRTITDELRKRADGACYCPACNIVVKRCTVCLLGIGPVSFRRVCSWLICLALMSISK